MKLLLCPTIQTVCGLCRAQTHVVIFLGLALRWIGTVVACSEPKFNCKEKMFMGFAWIPKATVQAAIGGTVFIKAQGLSLDEVRQETKD